MFIKAMSTAWSDLICMYIYFLWAYLKKVLRIAAKNHLHSVWALDINEGKVTAEKQRQNFMMPTDVQVQKE